MMSNFELPSNFHTRKDKITLIKTIRDNWLLHSCAIRSIKWSCNSESVLKLCWVKEFSHGTFFPSKPPHKLIE